MGTANWKLKCISLWPIKFEYTSGKSLNYKHSWQKGLLPQHWPL